MKVRIFSLFISLSLLLNISFSNKVSAAYVPGLSDIIGGVITNFADSSVKIISPVPPKDGNTNWFGPWTPGTTTAGLQELWNSFKVGDLTTNLGGGMVYVMPGYYEVGGTVVIPANQTASFGVTMWGANPISTIFIQTNTIPTELINFNAYGRTNSPSLYMNGLGFASVTNAATNIIDIIGYLPSDFSIQGNFAGGKIENCLFGWWRGLTNHPTTWRGVNMQGFADGLNTHNLCAIRVVNNYGGDFKIVNNSFSYLAGVSVANDNTSFFGNQFVSCGSVQNIDNDWPTNSPMRAGCVLNIVDPPYAANGLNSTHFANNHFVGNTPGYLFSLGNVHRPIIIEGDDFEGTGPAVVTRATTPIILQDCVGANSPLTTFLVTNSTDYSTPWMADTGFVQVASLGYNLKDYQLNITNAYNNFIKFLSSSSITILSGGGIYGNSGIIIGADGSYYNNAGSIMISGAGGYRWANSNPFATITGNLLSWNGTNFVVDPYGNGLFGNVPVTNGVVNVPALLTIGGTNVIQAIASAGGAIPNGLVTNGAPGTAVSSFAGFISGATNADLASTLGTNQWYDFMSNSVAYRVWTLGGVRYTNNLLLNGNIGTLSNVTLVNFTLGSDFNANQLNITNLQNILAASGNADFTGYGYFGGGIHSTNDLTLMGSANLNITLGNLTMNGITVITNGGQLNSSYYSASGGGNANTNVATAFGSTLSAASTFSDNSIQPLTTGSAMNIDTIGTGALNIGTAASVGAITIGSASGSGNVNIFANTGGGNTMRMGGLYVSNGKVYLQSTPSFAISGANGQLGFSATGDASGTLDTTITRKNPGVLLQNGTMAYQYGTSYRSNTFSLSTFTNYMANFEYKIGTSNNGANISLISCWLSNGVPYIKVLSYNGQ